jgi:ankyrin repeat protein
VSNRFRWTHLQWEQLKIIDTNGGLEQRLGSLPKTLEEAYDELYARSNPEGPERLMLQRAVRWVMCARKPLSSRTLLSAMRMESEKEDATNVFQEADLTKASLETVCRHLVVHDQRLDEWKFPHASVSEYFKERGKEWMTDREVRIAGLLVEFLADCCSNYGKARSPRDAGFQDEDEDSTSSSSDESWRSELTDPDNSLHPRHPLQKYTSRHWAKHIQGLSGDDSKATKVVEPLKKFIGEGYSWKQPSSAYQIFCKHILPQVYAFQSWRVESRAKEHPAFLVAYLGLDKVLQGWWDRDLEPSWFKADEGSDLLAVAAAFGRIDICAGLIRRGCDVNRRTSQNALEAAITNRRIDITELLLDTGANPNAIVNGQSVLCVAAAEGGQYVQLLMKKGADPNIRCTADCFNGSALSAAANFNQIESLSVLIKNGANINSQDPESPLSVAAYRGNLECVRLLIEHGAYANVLLQYRAFGSPLAAAACLGNLECARLLIEHGADSNASLQYGEYGSPLAAAAYNGNLECARLLIEHGADANALLQHGGYGSPLAAAVCMGRLECARLLIEHGADANILLQHGEYGSPLAAAAFMGRLECARLLIEHGADANILLQHGEYGSPLAAAVAGGELECVRLLIEHGADASAFLQYGEYGSVLAAAILGENAQLEVVRYLVEERGAGPTHLANARSTREEVGKWSVKDYREILAYLIKDCRFDPQLLHGIGVDPQYMRPGAMDLPRNINGT